MLTLLCDIHENKKKYIYTIYLGFQARGTRGSLRTDASTRDPSCKIYAFIYVCMCFGMLHRHVCVFYMRVDVFCVLRFICVLICLSCLYPGPGPEGPWP
jgi:hypothetical protein